MPYRGIDDRQSALDAAFFLNAAKHETYSFQIRSEAWTTNLGTYTVTMPRFIYGNHAYVSMENMARLTPFFKAMSDPDLSAANEDSLLHRATHDIARYANRGWGVVSDISGAKAAVEELVQVLADPEKHMKAKGGEYFFVLSSGCVDHLCLRLADIADHLQRGVAASDKYRAFWTEAVRGTVENEVSLFDRLRMTRRSRPRIDEKIVPKLPKMLERKLLAGS